MHSAKANEIHDYIVNHNLTDHWVAVAKTFLKKRRQYRAEPDWKRDRAGLVERLKTELSGQIADANDDDWRENADWLFGLAIPQ